MLGRQFEKRMWLAVMIAFIGVVVVAPMIGCFAFSPLLVAGGIQPYPLAAALGCMLAEALTVTALIFLVLRSKK